MTVNPYNKPSTSIEEQINLLRNRGLGIKNQAEVEHYLTFIGYYRLAGYWQMYQNDHVNHTFHEGTSFRHVTELYNFDRELRILLNDAIERIEVALRTLIANIMCNSYGPNWLSDENLAERKDRFSDNLISINSEPFPKFIVISSIIFLRKRLLPDLLVCRMIYGLKAG